MPFVRPANPADLAALQAFDEFQEITATHLRDVKWWHEIQMHALSPGRARASVLASRNRDWNGG